MTSEDGTLESEHALAWGRAGPGVTVVELRTDHETVSGPAVSSAGYFMLVAAGRDPSIAVHSANEHPGTTA
jgi:hypothetical protein